MQHPNPLNSVASAQWHAPAVKKSRPQPVTEYSPSRYMTAMQELFILQQKWNSVWNPEVQADYLTDMQDIIMYSHCSRGTLLVPDDRERFGELFLELPLSEKSGFYEICVTSHEMGKDIVAADIAKLFEKAPSRPFFVCLNPCCTGPAGVAHCKYQDGSQRFPFATIQAAERALNKKPRGESAEVDLDIAVLQCAPTCPQVTCNYPGCHAKICRDHGTGRGYQTHCQRSITQNHCPSSKSSTSHQICACAHRTSQPDSRVVFDAHGCISCGQLVCRQHSTNVASSMNPLARKVRCFNCANITANKITDQSMKIDDDDDESMLDDSDDDSSTISTSSSDTDGSEGSAYWPTSTHCM